jgi:predicted O-methyltransferase YrrM
MIRFFSKLAANLGPRLQLLKIACTRRYVWDDIAAMGLGHGLRITEIRGNTHPFHFAAPFFDGTTVSPPDFKAAVGQATTFAPKDAPTWNSEPSVGEFLGELAFRMRAQTVVELGCYVGWSSAHLAVGMRAAGAGRLWCLDSDTRYLEVARGNLARLGLADRVEFVQGLSTEARVLDTLPAAIDLLFLDTTHEYEDTRRELALYLPRLAPGGVIAMHDSVSAVGVRRALLELGDKLAIFTFATEEGNGVTVLRPRLAH